MKKDFLRLAELSREELAHLLDRAAWWKAHRTDAAAPRPLAGKSVALLFDKASTRTRVSLEVAAAELGGRAIFASGRDSQLGRGEPPEDTARVLSRMVHAVCIRTFSHEWLERFARAATIPVVNALTDLTHPLQLLADLLVLRERFGRTEGLKVAWIGDGNNVAHAFIEAAPLAGFELSLACPAGYLPDGAALAWARERGARVQVVDDPRAAARGAHALVTDVWASMGQEAEQAARKQAFAGYCVDESLLEAALPEAIVLHCLPAHRGEEISAAAIDGPRSAVWDEAENRLHTSKALLESLLRN